MLSEENSALKSVMKGQEGEMQREINNLLVKMKGLSSLEHAYQSICWVNNKLWIASVPITLKQVRRESLGVYIWSSYQLLEDS